MTRNRLILVVALVGIAGIVATLAVRRPAADDMRTPPVAARDPSTPPPAPVPAADRDSAPPAPDPVAESVPADAAMFAAVVDADGRPVPGAKVAAYPAEPLDRGSWSLGSRYYPTRDVAKPTVTATTGRTGRACLAGLTSGRWRVVVDAPPSARTETETAWVKGDAPREVVVRMSPGHSLTASVRDRAGRPASGVEVVVAAEASRFGPAGPTRTWRAVTGADGTCVVTPIPDGLLEVWAVPTEGSPVGGTPVKVPGVARVEIELPGAAHLTGRVVDPHGVGVAGATVSFQSDGRATTAADGRYDVRSTGGLASVERIDVRAAGFATVRRTVERVRVDEGQSHEFADIALSEEARIEGTVSGPDGPIAGAQVGVLVPGTGSFGEMEREDAETGVDGKYSIGGLAAAEVVVKVDAAGFLQEGADRYGNVGGTFGPRSDRMGDVPDVAKATVVPGRAVVKDVRMLRSADSTLIHPVFSGVVRNEDGTPAPWADVWVSGAANHCWIYKAGATLTAADGTFRVIATAAAGDFAVSASADGLACEAVRFDIADARETSGIALVLTRTPYVRGVVRSKAGTPVAGAVVHAGTRHAGKSGSTAYWDEQSPVVAAADGAYVLVLGGRMTSGSSWDSQGDEIVICAEAPGLAPAISREFKWDEAAKGAVVDVDLDAGAAIAGRVVGEDGQPVADAPITLVKQGGRWNHGEWPPAYPPMPEEAVWTRTAKDGSFRIEHLMPAAYAIETSARGLISASVDVTAPGESVEIRLLGANSVSGVVVAPGGAPLEGADIGLAPAAGGYGRSAKTDASGTFAFENLASGKWIVTVTPSDEGPDVRPFTAEVAAGTTGLRLEAKPGLAIAGTLLDADGRPVADAAIGSRRLDDGPGAWSGTKTGADGKFALRRLAPGRHAITFDADDDGVEFGEFDAGATPTLRLPGSLTIAGTARAAGDDKEKTFFSLRLRARAVDPPTGAPAYAFTCSMDSDTGKFEFRHLAPGRYAIEAMWGGAGDGMLSRIPAGTVLAAGAKDVVLTVEFVKDEEKK